MKKLLIIADLACSKQTFVSRANRALLDIGFDYRMIFTRGRWDDLDIDRPVSKRINYDLKPLSADILYLLRVISSALISTKTRQFISSTTSFEKGRRLAMSSAVINYQILKHVKRWQPDAIVCHFLWNVEIAIGLGDVLNIPVICVAHGSDVLIDKTWLDHVTHSRVGKILCVSHAIKKKIDETIPSLKNKTTVLYSPISPLYLQEPVPITAGHIKVVCVAALRDLKNHAWLFRALRLLKDADIRFECKLIGEPLPNNPGYAAVLRKMVEDLELTEQCSFVGWLAPAETKNVIDESTVLVLPSRSEGLGTVIIESLARQRCPVGTDIFSIREAMMGGRYGVLCPLDDDVGLSKAIEEAHQRTLTQSPVMFEGREKVAKLFSSRQYASQFSAFLNELTI